MQNPSEQGPVCPACKQFYAFKVGERTEYDRQTQKPIRIVKTWKCDCGHQFTRTEEAQPEVAARCLRWSAERNGQTVIYRTDNATDFIRQNIEDHIADYDLTGQVRAKVDDVGEGWMRIEITYPADLDPDTWMQIGTDFEAAFCKHGKHWYDCREEGQNQNGTIVWWIVKHNHGPWI